MYPVLVKKHMKGLRILSSRNEFIMKPDQYEYTAQIYRLLQKVFVLAALGKIDFKRPI